MAARVGGQDQQEQQDYSKAVRKRERGLSPARQLALRKIGVCPLWRFPAGACNYQKEVCPLFGSLHLGVGWLTIPFVVIEPLARRFFERPTLEVAPDLLGKLLVHEGNGERMIGRIVETEAYREDDPACHAWSKIKRRNGKAPWRGEVLMGEPGFAYIYLNYGMYWLLNVVTEPAGIGAAVLIRAVEPLDGIDLMRARRGVSRERDLTNGPGKLAQAFDIDDRYHRKPLTEPPLYLAASRPESTPPIQTSPRIGITRGAELPWRFYIPGNAWVSAT